MRTKPTSGHTKHVQHCTGISGVDLAAEENLVTATWKGNTHAHLLAAPVGLGLLMRGENPVVAVCC